MWGPKKRAFSHQVLPGTGESEVLNRRKYSLRQVKICVDNKVFLPTAGVVIVVHVSYFKYVIVCNKRK